MKTLNLKSEKRKVFGRKVKKLRQQDILPANIYGKKIKSQALQVDLKEFLEVYQQAGETGVVYLTVAGNKDPYSVLINNLQTHPVSDLPLHIDFRQVDLKEKVQVAIPIELINEAPGVSKGGILVQLMNEVEVEALPTDLPDKIEVDISGLEEIGNSIAIKDLKVDKAKVKILVENLDQLVVNIEAQKEEEEEEKPTEEVPAEGEGEKTEEEKKEESKVEEKKEEKTEEKKEESKSGEKK